jgi:hypothetical protein
MARSLYKRRTSSAVALRGAAVLNTFPARRTTNALQQPGVCDLLAEVSCWGKCVSWAGVLTTS